jgi:hypothetical protein
MDLRHFIFQIHYKLKLKKKFVELVRYRYSIVILFVAKEKSSQRMSTPSELILQYLTIVSSNVRKEKEFHSVLK